MWNITAIREVQNTKISLLHTHTHSPTPPCPLTIKWQVDLGQEFQDPIRRPETEWKSRPPCCFQHSPENSTPSNSKHVCFYFWLFLQEAPQGLAALFQEYTTQGVLSGCSSFYIRLSIYVLIRIPPNPFSIIKRSDTGGQNNLPLCFPLPAMTHPFNIYTEKIEEMITKRTKFRMSYVSMWRKRH